MPISDEVKNFLVSKGIRSIENNPIGGGDSGIKYYSAIKKIPGNSGDSYLFEDLIIAEVDLSGCSEEKLAFNKAILEKLNRYREDLYFKYTDSTGHQKVYFGQKRAGTTALLTSPKIPEIKDVANLLLSSSVSLQERVSLARKIVEKLQQLHQEGIVHADLHIANIMVGTDPRNNEWLVDIIDFDRSKLTRPGQDPEMIQWDSPGATGFAEHVAPECRRQNDKGEVDNKDYVDYPADIYALGKIFATTAVAGLNLNEMSSYPVGFTQRDKQYIQEFIDRMCDKNLINRPKLSEVIKFIKSIEIAIFWQNQLQTHNNDIEKVFQELVANKQTWALEELDSLMAESQGIYREQAVDIYSKIHALCAHNQQFFNDHKETIQQCLPALTDANFMSVAQLSVPNATEQLSYSHVRSVINILYTAVNDKFDNLPKEDISTYLKKKNCNEIITYTGNPFPEKFEKHLIVKFWESIATYVYYNPGKDLPDHLTMFSRINMGSAHWTSAITKIAIDTIKINKEQISSIVNAEKNRLVQHDESTIISSAASKLQLKYSNPGSNKEYVLPVKDINIYHYNSTNSSPSPNTERIENLCNNIFSNNNLINKLHLQRSGNQIGQECGDWTAVHCFLAGILGLTNLPLDINKITNSVNNSLRFLTQECVTLQLKITNDRLSNDQARNEIFQNPVIKNFFDQIGQPLNPRVNLGQPAVPTTATPSVPQPKAVPNPMAKPQSAVVPQPQSAPSSKPAPKLPSRSPPSVPTVRGNKPIALPIDTKALLPNVYQQPFCVKSGAIRQKNIDNIVTIKELKTKNIQKQLVTVPTGTTIAQINTSEQTIQCPIVGTLNENKTDNKHLLISQQQIFINFLLQQKEQLQSQNTATGSFEKITVEISGFTPEDLVRFLEVITTITGCQDLANYINLELAPADLARITDPARKKCIENLLSNYNVTPPTRSPGP